MPLVTETYLLSRAFTLPELKQMETLFHKEFKEQYCVGGIWHIVMVGRVSEFVHSDMSNRKCVHLSKKLKGKKK